MADKDSQETIQKTVTKEEDSSREVDEKTLLAEGKDTQEVQVSWDSACRV